VNITSRSIKHNRTTTNVPISDTLLNYNYPLVGLANLVQIAKLAISEGVQKFLSDTPPFTKPKTEGRESFEYRKISLAR